MSYLELDDGYGEDDGLQMLRDEVHSFARDELRPLAREIDAMSDDEYASIADRGSPYWEAMRQMKELGYHSALLPEEFGGGGLDGREFHVLMEEIGWGSCGFAVALGVDIMPATFAAVAFDDEIEEQFLEPYLADDEARFQGCWGVTEPAHGSELVMVESLLQEGVDEHLADGFGEPGVTMEEDADGYVVNGAKASWISAGPMATHCALHVDMDPAGGSPGALVVVPLDSDGVTKGAPIAKLGERDCPQGELVFDDVHVPESHVVMDERMLHPDTGYAPMDQVLCITSAGMAAMSTGLARAAFEEALAYAREREQGGKPIWCHQNVKQSLYEMFERVETARAYSRRVCEHVHSRNLEAFEYDASPRHALAGQVYCKRIAFEVAHEAMQIHGANGITKDYLVEKLFRDARVKLIEDGTVEVLGLESAHDAIQNYDLD